MEKKNTPFWDSSLPIEKRLDWLLARMTIEEKLNCLSSRMPALERLGIPAMSFGGEAAHGVEARNDQNRLGGPEPTTSFVQPIGMSATWDPELIKQAGTVTGTEARVIYHRHPDRGLSRWAPTVDLERDPRWGRTEEGYGEDPVLTGEMASAYVQGMQGDNDRYLRVAATLKHFYGNNTEVGRGWKNVSIDPRNKYELYLEPFRRAIEKGGAEAIMTAYNKINGTPGMLNDEVQKILKDEYGLVHAVSDGGATALVAALHHYYGTNAETVAAAVKAGVDTMSDDPVMVEQAAREAWELGLLTEEQIDKALRCAFRTRLRLGIYDAQPGNPYDRVTEADLDTAESRAVCRQVSREAVVLLKNEDGFLPLSKEQAGELALIGPLGDAWYQDWYGGEPPFRTTLLDGIKELTGAGIACADGLDRVVFRCGEQGIAVAEDGTLCLHDEPDVFIREDWGSGSHTFRCVRTGKYMNSRLYGGPDSKEEPGRIAAEKDSAMDWFVMEIFHVEPKEDGSVLLTNRFGIPVRAREDGSLWSVQGGDGTPFVMETVEDGLQEAVKLAGARKTVVLALGCNSMINAKEEVDRETIELPPAQEKLLEAVYAANQRVVLVLFSNYPYAVNLAQEKLPAILWSATGAQDMGAAMAETLFGHNNPAGRLNLTWYQGDHQLPDIDDYDIIGKGRTYRYFEGDVLYPFGYGLSYTQFAYSDLSVTLQDGAMLHISLKVENTGSVAGDEVVQIYGTAPASRVKKPLRQLLAFRRLKDVAPGESRRVEFVVPTEEFRFYDVISRQLMVEQGSYTIYAGPSSAQALLMAQVELPGQQTGERCLRQRTAADLYDTYENMVLTEGHFGFKAVVLHDPAKKGVLCYGDCKLEEGVQALLLHCRSAEKSSITVFIDDRKAAFWEGDTASYERMPMPPLDEKAREDAKRRKASWQPVYTDVRLPLDEALIGEVVKAGKAVEICLELTGDISLCSLQAEYKPDSSPAQ